MPKIKFELRLALAYLLVGGLWIIFSDKILFYLVPDVKLLTEIQTFKGWFYVIVTAVFFYFLLKEHLKNLRKAEHDARESERLKTAFLQNISHEIRTPLNGIMGFAELLNMDGINDLQKKEFTQIIVKSSDRLLSIVNDVLEISLLESGDIDAHNTTFCLNKLMDSLVLEFEHTIGKELDFSVKKTLPDSLSLIKTDELKLKRTIYNLLNNAIKFTEKGQIEFGYFIKDEKLEFYVKDTGIGIKEEQHSAIFDRFIKAETNKPKLYEGTGLGLAICKGYIKILKGNMWLESQFGMGSTFYFSIPYVKGVIEGNLIQSENVNKKTGKFTILLIEDERSNYEYVKAVFSETDFILLNAWNGKEGINIVYKEKQIDLILLDLKLPDINGYEVLKKLKEIAPNIPVIAQSAFAMDDEKKFALESGFTDFLAKPFRKDQLRSIINKHLPENK